MAEIPPFEQAARVIKDTWLEGRSSNWWLGKRQRAGEIRRAMSRMCIIGMAEELWRKVPRDIVGGSALLSGYDDEHIRISKHQSSRSIFWYPANRQDEFISINALGKAGSEMHARIIEEDSGALTTYYASTEYPAAALELSRLIRAAKFEFVAVTGEQVTINTGNYL